MNDDNNNNEKSGSVKIGPLSRSLFFSFRPQKKTFDKSLASYI